MIRRTILLICFVLLSVVPALGALRIDLPEHAMNGRAFLVTVHTNAQAPVCLKWNNTEISVSCVKDSDGYRGVALLALPRDFSEKTLQVSAVEETAAGTNIVTRTIPVQHKKYREQHLNVDRKYVELSKKSLDRHYAERATVRSMMTSLAAERKWDADFLRPVPGGVSSEFGVQRFFNGKPRKAHSGIDLRGKKGTSIKACADGVVRIAASHFFSGESIYIDHGQGVVSMYFHMSKLLVREGETVKKGQVIGQVGSTGRVTGPHLHFGLNVSGVAVDPIPLFTAKK
ncbi:M23 family metallopeptidase [Halodesulfovibrio marinisediminis]|uniref:Murein DD-endopeptidase MepM and murein hydrolase activator NlpD, contain LysM domain n=1 Tax=Halodesulfovibrio marinisediminis DSM 17456 TaxID=1121457 RepID=A0A1N6DMM7_9BACT|nr:M23 family metallopeptidase [Halodesulfovibrio marinisediminis]SIN72025.1 Murein DD-endopeptidase MepM and murein hydrolase activator NlpD, contain LysM domain [Halodesulfovibrio marinisediminis DSM 17456]